MEAPLRSPSADAPVHSDTLPFPHPQPDDALGNVGWLKTFLQLLTRCYGHYFHQRGAWQKTSNFDLERTVLFTVFPFTVDNWSNDFACMPRREQQQATKARKKEQLQALRQKHQEQKLDVVRERYALTSRPAIKRQRKRPRQLPKIDFSRGNACSSCVNNGCVQIIRVYNKQHLDNICAGIGLPGSLCNTYALESGLGKTVQENLQVYRWRNNEWILDEYRLFTRSTWWVLPHV